MNTIIKKIELLDKGNKGIKVTFAGQRKINDQVAAKRDNVMTEHMLLPIPLRQKFYRLKYFFLTMSGVWRDDQWTEYLLDDYSGFRSVDDILEQDHEGADEDVLEKLRMDISSKIMAADTAFSNTSISGYELDGTKIKINGTYEAIEGKPFKVTLPFISEDDDYEFHSEATEIMVEISTDTFQYLKEENLQLSDVKELLSEYMVKDEDIERVKNQSDEENLEELMLRLENAGAIVIPTEGGDLEKSLNENNDNSKPEVASTKTINEEKFVNSEEQKDVPDNESGSTDEDSDNEEVEGDKNESYSKEDVDSIGQKNDDPSKDPAIPYPNGSGDPPNKEDEENKDFF